MPGVPSAGSALLHARHCSADACSAFGFDNPQFSDRVLHILQVKDDESSEAKGAAQNAAVLRSVHVNSLTLAANSEVLRYKDHGLLETKKHSTLYDML